MIHRFSILFLTLILVFSGCSKKDIFIDESRLMMGTVVNIKVPKSSQKDIKSAIAKSFSKIKEIEGLLNRFDGNSEVAIINRSRDNEEIELSPKMVFVLRKSLDLNRLTDGAFDITVSPLLELWGFYKKKETIPADKEIKDVLSKVGSEKILLSEDGTLVFTKDGVKLDLSGIAKGYAIDEAVKVLKENGIENGLIDAGGDIYCMGHGADKKGWSVGVMHPREKRLLGTLTLKNKAVATSGDYQKFFFVGKKRYSHIIDPRTGYPISETPMSVTVIAFDCITADGLATAISVMGPDDGLKFAEEHKGIEALIVSKNKDSLRVDITSGLKDFYESF